MKINRRTALSLAVVLIAALAGGAWLLVNGAKRTPADPSNAAQVARGETVYRERCANCHGARLEGQPNWQSRKADGRLPAPPHDAGGHTWHHSDAQIFALTKLGLQPFAPPGYASDMPAFDGVLPDDDIWAVLAYIKSTWPPEIRDRQRQINDAARR